MPNPKRRTWRAGKHAYLRYSCSQFYAQTGKSERTYVTLTLNPEAAGELQAAMYLFATRAANNTTHAEVILAMRDEIARAIKEKFHPTSDFNPTQPVIKLWHERELP